MLTRRSYPPSTSVQISPAVSVQFTGAAYRPYQRTLRLAFASADESAVIECCVAHDADTADGVPEDVMW
jgi:hypothetical protein